VNKVIIMGVITRDIELKYSQAGKAIGSFGIAYNDKWKDQSGQVQEKAHFFDCSAFGRKAEALQKYFKKGQRILIDGSLDFQQWQDQSGQNRSKVCIKVDNFDFIERKNESNNYQANQQQPSAQYQGNNGNVPVYIENQSNNGQGTPPPFEIDDGQIPF